MTNSEISSFMKELCDLAQAETLPRFRAGNVVENKKSAGFDPVTLADKQAEIAIRRRIEERFPDHGILGEEFGTVRGDAEFCWIIDPVDGTRAFISGMPVWGTLIGLYKNRQPFAGMMHQPFIQEYYYSDGLSSVYERLGKTAKLRTMAECDISDAILMATSPEMFTDAEVSAFNCVGKSARMVRYGGDCYAYCQLAAGQVGLVIESDLQAYDVAALIPIVEKAGGVFTDWRGGPVSNGGQVLAAANANLHKQALSLLNKG